ncbi:MAG: preprotein translocase subunit SecE [Candidatus Moraniibacteriota bacterium]|nr:MAG: preprotein translocase subunit SecE [Candidatus Moranbacteria bacterium]
MKAIIRFFTEAKAELTKVSWPSRPELVRYTILVVIISLAVAIFLGVLDVAFSYLVENYLIK